MAVILWGRCGLSVIGPNRNHAAEYGTRSGVQKRPSGTTHPQDHPGTQSVKRFPVAAALNK
jgi:hypothetical protein